METFLLIIFFFFQGPVFFVLWSTSLATSVEMPKVAFEDVAFQLDLGEPSQELLEWAKENLGETEEEKSMKLYELREMIYGKYTPAKYLFWALKLAILHTDHARRWH